MMVMTRTVAFKAAQPVGALATSSDRIDVCGWSCRGHRESSSVELITICFKNFVHCSSIPAFPPIYLPHIASLNELALF